MILNCKFASNSKTNLGYMLKKLKERWEVKNNLQVVLILIVFSITGSITAWISKPVVDWLGLTEAHLPLWLLIPVRLLLVLPVYCFLLVIIGSIFGQFKFFSNFVKKMFSRFIPKKKVAKQRS
jgi:ABC-type multidrug transport system fused ATPase/permease subunit